MGNENHTRSFSPWPGIEEEPRVHLGSYSVCQIFSATREGPAALDGNGWQKQHAGASAIREEGGPAA